MRPDPAILQALQTGDPAVLLGRVPDTQEGAARAGGATAAGQIKNIEDLPRLGDVGAHQPSWVVENLIPEGAVVLLTGEAGSGKTTFAAALCGAVASGAPFGRRETWPRKTLILDRENPAAVAAERLRRLGLTRAEAAGLLHWWGHWVGEEPPTPAAGIVLEWAARTTPRPLILVDSSIAFLRADENDASAVRAFLNQARQLANVGATPLLLHHVGKTESARSYRGSSDFPASVDCAFRLTRLGSSSRFEGARLECFKSRTIVSEFASFQFNPETYLFTETGGEVGEGSEGQELLNIVAGAPGLTFGDLERIAESRGVGRNGARELRKDLLKRGLLRMETDSKSRAKRLFLVRP